MSTTFFFFRDQLVSEMNVPEDNRSAAANILRRNTVYFCHHCGEIWARRVSTDPLFDHFDIQFNNCQEHKGGYFMFNKYDLCKADFEASGIDLILVLPYEILVQEILYRED